MNDPTLGDILQQQNDEEPDVGRSALKLRSLILVSASLLGMGSIQASLAMARCIQSGRKMQQARDCSVLDHFIPITAY